jgi:hypothetical protein
MAYSPRRIQNNHIYEICLRTGEGLPFSCSELINSLLIGIMARANRDDKVKVCHFVWLANHAHILLVANRPEDFCAYYGEVMKKVTETFKALFGITRLDLWQGRISVIELITLEDVEERIAYFYLNPARANLVSSIEKYPGLSSWHFFQSTSGCVDAFYTQPVKWYRYNELPPLLGDSDSTDIHSVSRLNPLKGYTKESFILQPNVWMKSFGIETPEEVKAINRRIINAVNSEQAALKAHRCAEGKSVIGTDRLKQETPTLSGWKPKKNGRRIFIVCRNISLRKEYIREYKNFCQCCAEARQRVLAGLKNVFWPQGAFIPWFPPCLRGAVSPLLVPLAA